jgi:hypothetical protein
MTLLEQVTRTLTVAGCRMPDTIARQLIRIIRDADQPPITWRPLPLPDCPDGCIVGAEWRRRALVAEDTADG